MTTMSGSRPANALVRRYNEFRLIARDPVLFGGLLAVGAFILAFVVWPLARVIWQGFFTLEGEPNLQIFQRYFEPKYTLQYWQIFWWTLQMGVLTALGSTAVGFLFAYTVVRCNVPFKTLVHALTLLPTISPPFAIALATILLFGRSGFVTREVLHMQFRPGDNDIYGMDGLVLVQIITFFSVAYLILRGLLERIDPSMEEAALSLGASKWHIFRTVTLPLLAPGIAASFLLMFVEALADLGNPIMIGGNVTVLSTQIWIAVNGEYDQQKGAALSLVLLLPTLTVYILQRYWLANKSFIAVTGKPTGGSGFVKEPLIRWTFISLTFLVLLLVVSLYAAIFMGSITKLWGIDNTLDFTHYGKALDRGLKAILDTSFLSAVATPIAGLTGMIIALLVVRRQFSGKEALDFASNLGGAVPGTILGIGYIVAFIKAPLIVVAIIYAALAVFMIGSLAGGKWRNLLVLALGTLGGLALNFLALDAKGRAPLLENPLLAPLGALPMLAEGDWLNITAALLIALGMAALVWTRANGRYLTAGLLIGMGAYLLTRTVIPDLTQPLIVTGKTLGGNAYPKIFAWLASSINFCFQTPYALLGFTYAFIGTFVLERWAPRGRAVAAVTLMAASAALTFQGETLALVGTPYIIVAAYAVRSLPASVRAGIAALQQIDPAIEEASTSLGADAQLTFRRVTLPLIAPAFVAGMIFSFARHMTSLSAIIFLSSPKWQILTALILSEVEQGGTSLAAAYSMVLIFIVLGAIGLLYLWAGRAFRNASADLTGGR